MGWTQVNTRPEEMVLRPIILQGLPLCQKATPAFIWVSAQEEAGLAFPCSQRCQHQDDSQ